MDRRRFLMLTLNALLVAVAPASAVAVDTRVSVSRRGDVFLVDAVLVAPVTGPEAWRVLTDFDAMSGFVPDLETSRVTARSGERLRVEQTGVARWGPLAHSFSMVREIEMEPMQLVRSHSLTESQMQVRSVTRFVSVAGGTEIRHQIEISLDTWLPAALIEPFLRHEVREQFDAVVAEMLRRRAVEAVPAVR
jgi:Polyketide cyclase / dehydrase and lipid transport